MSSPFIEVKSVDFQPLSLADNLDDFPPLNCVSYISTRQIDEQLSAIYDELMQNKTIHHNDFNEIMLREWFKRYGDT